MMNFNNTQSVGTNVEPKPASPREVPVAWEALEDAFENNAPEVHSYLSLASGEVLRVVDGVADPQMHARIAEDSEYVRVDPVSSREQYRWMERFIETVTEPELRDRLLGAIDGKGAFRRFKDVLMTYPVDRERWFAFRSERLKACMELWLETHDIRSVPRPEWKVPTADEVRPTQPDAEAEAAVKRSTRAEAAEAVRERLRTLVDLVPARELETAAAFLEFLRERRRLPRSKPKSTSVAPAALPGAEGPSAAQGDASASQGHEEEAES